MGMGYGANYAYTCKTSLIERLCPAEYKSFYARLDDEALDFDSFAMYFDQEDPCVETIRPAYDNLRIAFYNATDTGGEGGLYLGVAYHDQEEGSRYDDVTGGYWTLEGVVKRTPAGKRFADEIEKSFFVTFG